MHYFILGIDGAHGVTLLTRSAFATLAAAELYASTVSPALHPFIVQEIKEFLP